MFVYCTKDNGAHDVRDTEETNGKSDEKGQGKHRRCKSETRAHKRNDDDDDEDDTGDDDDGC